MASIDSPVKQVANCFGFASCHVYLYSHVLMWYTPVHVPYILCLWCMHINPCIVFMTSSGTETNVCIFCIL